MKIALIAAGVLLLLGAGLWGLILLGLKDPLQDVPVAEREWGGAAAIVRQMNFFELGKPGRTEYYLVAAAPEPVGRCPEAASDKPSFAETRANGTIRLELKPTRTGGRCGRRGFSGTTMPDDPRRLEVRLPDLEKGPVRVVFAEGAREAEYVLRADAERVAFEKVSDPAGLVRPRFPAFKRLPRTLFLATGLDRSTPSLWGGNIRVEAAPGADGGAPEKGDAVGEAVQYCRGPEAYEYAGGTATGAGRETDYMQGTSDSSLDELYRELSEAEKSEGRSPAFTLYRLGLDGSLEKRPQGEKHDGRRKGS